MSKNSHAVNWGEKIHEQFIRQAKWTEDFRNQIYRKIQLRNARRILELGCGTGVITAELKLKTSGKITAVDFDLKMLDIAKKNVENVNFQVEDVESLSMKNNLFDIVLCQYFFLWLVNPKKAIAEMIRVCKNGGYIVALAEPDYGAWIEYPELNLGNKHIQYLMNEGADPYIGRKMLNLFEEAGLKTDLISIAQSWDQENLRKNIKKEWKRVLEANLITKEEYSEIIATELQLIDKNQRMIFIPVFCTIGRK